MRELKLGHIYKHFKGNYYIALDIVNDSENPDQKMVVYQTLYGEYGKWVRPLEMFLSEVDHEKYPEVTQKYRFEEVDL